MTEPLVKCADVNWHIKMVEALAAAEARATAAEAVLFDAQKALLKEGLARTAAEGERDALRGREKALREALERARGCIRGLETLAEIEHALRAAGRLGGEK